MTDIEAILPRTPCVVPEPLRIEAGDARRALAESPAVWLRPEAAPTEAYAFEMLRRDMQRAFGVEPRRVETPSDADIVLATPEAQPALAGIADDSLWRTLAAMPKEEDHLAEGYVVARGGGDPSPTLVLATDPSGLLYGCLTLSQLLEKTPAGLALPEPLYVEDRPAMLERGRVGLARASNDPAYLETLDEAARWRVNVTYFGHPMPPGVEGTPQAAAPPAGMRETIGECHRRGMRVYGLVSFHGLLRRLDRQVLLANEQDAAYVKALFEGLIAGGADGLIFMFDDIPPYIERDRLPDEHIGWVRLMKQVADRQGVERLIFCPTPYGAWWNASQANIEYHRRFGAAQDLGDVGTYFCPSTSEQIAAAQKVGLRNYVWWHNGVWDAGKTELSDYAGGVFKKIWAGIRRVEWAWYYGYDCSPELINELRTIGERTRRIWVCGSADATWANYAWNPARYDPDRSEARVAETLFGRGAARHYLTAIHHVRRFAVDLDQRRTNADDFARSDAAAREAVDALELASHQSERPGLWPETERMKHRRMIEESLCALRLQALEPVVDEASKLFIGSTEVHLDTRASGSPVRYTLDGSAPHNDSPLCEGPIAIDETKTLVARAEAPKGLAVDPPLAVERLVRAEPFKPATVATPRAGLACAYLEGMFNGIAEIDVASARHIADVADFTLDPALREEWFALIFTGYLEAPETGVYTIYLDSDDGSRLYLHDHVVIDNDNQHGPREYRGAAALEKGLHPMRLVYFQYGGEKSLSLAWKGPGFEREPIPAGRLFRPES